MNKYELQKHQIRLQMADGFAQYSPDPSSKIGAVLYNEYAEACGHGWNSFPNKMVVPKSHYHNRPLKYDRVIHAEMRCIMMAGTNCYGGYLYTGCPPCKECAKHIAEAGVARVYFWESRLHHPFVLRNPENVNVAMQLFAECDIKIIQIPDMQ